MRIYRKIDSIATIAIGAFACLLLTGCESDPIEPADNRQPTTVELFSYSTSFLEVTPWNSTRAGNNETHFGFAGYQANHLPNGYISYEVLHPHASTDDSTIGVFLTPVSANPAGDFIYQGINNGVSEWKSTIVVEENKDYYIYGFMPKTGAEIATITSLNGSGGADFANGAVISINSYDALTTADVSVIVGLRWASEQEKINGIDPDTGSDVPLGHFKYVGEAKGDNRLFVLLKHIYAGLHFATKLDENYAALRNIRITKVELTALDIKEKVNLTIKLEANSSGEDPLTEVTYASASTYQNDKTITLYEKTDAADDLGVVVPSNDYEDFLGCMVPGSATSFVLKTTFDVYDRNVTAAHREGNLTRKDCVVENVINLNTNLMAGELFTIKMLIKPTYLYVMSDPDLDNPTITLIPNTTTTP